MRAKWGQRAAKKLQLRLEQLGAADCLADMSRLPGARCHQLTGDRAEILSVDLVHPYRLLFVVANEPAPRKPDGGLDWSQITEIEILSIEDTH
ncbi:MAG: type II toxin-antitoxin system RelE/ParE family toxin [Phycisphaerae bacterium]